MLKSKHMRLKLIKGFTPSEFAPVRITRRFIALIKKTVSSHGNDALRTPAGFTLNELLIVIAILAILAGATVLVLNPGELLGQARDSKRIGELNSLASAITFHTNSIVGGYKGEENTVYISLPDTVETCDTLLPSLPAIPAGWSYHCVTAENLQKTDGDGWLPINLNATPGGSPFEQLPIDPENSAANNLYFAYVKSDTGYTLASLLESEKQGVEARKDGGSDFSRFEVGTDLSIWSEASGLVGYWTMNEGSGVSVADSSGNENTGTITGANWTENGKLGSALSFNSTSDWVRVNSAVVLNNTTAMSVTAWIKSNTISEHQTIVSRNGPFFLRLSGGKLRVGIYTGTWRFVNGIKSLESNTWYHIVLTYDGLRMKSYINGVLDTDNEKTGGLTAFQHMYFGYPTPVGEQFLFNGVIDEIQIFNRALAPAEIKAIYNATK